MRATTIKAGIRTDDVSSAFAAIADFARFPALAADVRSVVRDPAGTQWTVNFRRGLLRWHETDTVDGLTIAFTQTEGDFAEFHGSWRLTPTSEGALVTFEAAWDFGIDSLAGLMDPIAERVITRVVLDVLRGLFGDVTVLAGAARTDLEAA